MSTAAADEHSMRIRVVFDPAQVSRPTAEEVLPATLVAPGEARIDGVPVFAAGLALHDVVAFTLDGDTGRAAHRIARAGNGVVRTVAPTAAVSARIRAVVGTLGRVAVEQRGHWAIDVPDAAAMAHLIEQLATIPGIGALTTSPAPLSGLERAASVMARIRERCVWTQQITHADLLPYLVEESAEVIEAVEHGSPADVREELGDLLWQVLFHAEIAARDADEPFTVEDVAQALAEKMVRRHPHVFGAASAATPAEVLAHWNAAKAAEKRERRSVLDGVPPAMPALARAQKVLARAATIGIAPVALDASEAGGEERPLGEALLALAHRAREQGIDAEAALRRATARLEARVVTAEADAS